jgi:hypothetical protein
MTGGRICVISKQLSEAAEAVRFDIGHLGPWTCIAAESGEMVAYRATVEPPAVCVRSRVPRNWESRVRLYHATSQAGLRGILHSGRVLPRPSEEGGAGSHGVYAVGVMDEPRWNRNEAWRAQVENEKANKILGLWGSMKNTCGVAVEMLAIASVHSLKSGESEVDFVRPGQMAHRRGSHSWWCVAPEDIQITAVLTDPHWSDE